MNNSSTWKALSSRLTWLIYMPISGQLELQMKSCTKKPKTEEKKKAACKMAQLVKVLDTKPDI